ncbi:uncharacterized protein BX663DRAFT_517459, partial [Cokeromyces recurvatus]|uniref:uncharacterized protein n=1 Tax=Cokeromyces recurvatus TaxID=90255 RepID=UPI00221FCD52
MYLGCVLIIRVVTLPVSTFIKNLYVVPSTSYTIDNQLSFFLNQMQLTFPWSPLDSSEVFITFCFFIYLLFIIYYLFFLELT